MIKGRYEDAAWDGPIELSRDSGFGPKHFSATCRNFRNELDNEDLQVSSNQDLTAIVRSRRYGNRDWWQYVDSAASMSVGRGESTAIILLECENHVLTCRKIQDRWSLIPGHALSNLIDVSESRHPHLTNHHNHREAHHELFQDVDDIFTILTDIENNEMPTETAENVSTSIQVDLEEEGTERSLLIFDQELEKSPEND